MLQDASAGQLQTRLNRIGKRCGLHVSALSTNVMAIRGTERTGEKFLLDAMSVTSTSGMFLTIPTRTQVISCKHLIQMCETITRTLKLANKERNRLRNYSLGYRKDENQIYRMKTLGNKTSWILIPYARISVRPIDTFILLMNSECRMYN